MKLSTGKEVTVTARADGSRAIDQVLTGQEWEEYCTLKKVLLVAERLRGNRWTVVPSGKNGQGQLGTCASWPYLWQIQYVNARSAAEALRKATQARADFRKWQATLA